MPAPGTSAASAITVRHPEGSIRVSALTDVPLGELLPDVLELAGLPDHQDWVLGPLDGPPYAPDRTLAQLGVDDGALVALREIPGDASAGSESAPTQRPDEWPTLGSTEGAGGRPLSDRSARILPVRLSIPARYLSVLGALARGDRGEQHSGRESAVLGPAGFTRPPRLSPLSRVHKAWAHSDYRQRLEQTIATPRLQRCVTIAIVSPKGGARKTTTTALLGSLLAFLRRDRVIAVETNPDWGSLGRRLVPDHPVFIDELLGSALGEPDISPTRLDAQLGRGPDGLMVAPAPTDPDRAAKLDETAYRTPFARLSELVGTLVLDCGTGLDDPPARAALACADQLVLVCDDEPDTASIVAEAAGWLRHAGPPLTLVVNNQRRRSRIDLAALERATDFAQGFAVVPRDESGAGQLHNSRFTWKHAPDGWKTPIRELAALLAADWQRLQIAQ
jgi:MinD-like ATPase involved in chromosome partitioning or flagellar assembly